MIFSEQTFETSTISLCLSFAVYCLTDYGVCSVDSGLWYWQVRNAKLPAAICIFPRLRSVPLSYQRELTTPSSSERCGAASIWAINVPMKTLVMRPRVSLLPSTLFLPAEDEGECLCSDGWEGRARNTQTQYSFPCLANGSKWICMIFSETFPPELFFEHKIIARCTFCLPLININWVWEDRFLVNDVCISCYFLETSIIVILFDTFFFLQFVEH